MEMQNIITGNVSNISLDDAAQNYFNCKEKESFYEMVRAGSRLVYHFARLYSGNRVNEDILQVGQEGLLKAIHRFDPKRNIKFATFASHYIMGEIRHYIRKEASFYRPGCIVDLQFRVERIVEKSIKESGQIPSHSDIAFSLNVKENGVMEAMQASLVSLDEMDLSQIHHEWNEGFHLPIEDRIALTQALHRLDLIQQKVIYLRFFKDMTQYQIAQRMGMTQKKVSRLLQKSLRLLHGYLVG